MQATVRCADGWVRPVWLKRRGHSGFCLAGLARAEGADQWVQQRVQPNGAAQSKGCRPMGLGQRVPSLGELRGGGDSTLEGCLVGRVGWVFDACVCVPLGRRLDYRVPRVRFICDGQRFRVRCVRHCAPPRQSRTKCRWLPNARRFEALARERGEGERVWGEAQHPLRSPWVHSSRLT